MGAELNIQRFERKRQIVEAVQLTADADWEAIAKWCGGTVTEVMITFGGLEGLEIAVLGDWIVRDGGTFKSRTDGELLDEFQSVSESDDIASEIRTTLEGTTPGPWMRYCLEEPDSKEWIINETTGLELAYLGDVFDNDERAEATAALIAAAPELLARAADRIEQLEAIVTEIGRSFDGEDGVCMVCGSWVGSGCEYANKHADSCEVLAAINISKEGA